MSIISVIMKTMFVIACGHNNFDSLFNLTRAEPSRKEPSKWDFGRERELARIKKILKRPPRKRSAVLSQRRDLKDDQRQRGFRGPRTWLLISDAHGMANAHANNRICRNHACPIV